MGLSDWWLDKRDNRILKKKRKIRDKKIANLYPKSVRIFCEAEGCNEKLKGVDFFECNYCHKEFCKKHRLPAEHDCKGNPTVPEEMKQDFQSWSFSKG